jgi:hypothetical protein
MGGWEDGRMGGCDDGRMGGWDVGNGRQRRRTSTRTRKTARLSYWIGKNEQEKGKPIQLKKIEQGFVEQ